MRHSQSAADPGRSPATPAPPLQNTSSNGHGVPGPGTSSSTGDSLRGPVAWFKDLPGWQQSLAAAAVSGSVLGPGAVLYPPPWLGAEQGGGSLQHARPALLASLLSTADSAHTASQQPVPSAAVKGWRLSYPGLSMSSSGSPANSRPQGSGAQQAASAAVDPMRKAFLLSRSCREGALQALKAVASALQQQPTCQVDDDEAASPRKKVPEQRHSAAGSRQQGAPEMQVAAAQHALVAAGRGLQAIAAAGMEQQLQRQLQAVHTHQLQEVQGYQEQLLEKDQQLQAVLLKLVDTTKQLQTLQSQLNKLQLQMRAVDARTPQNKIQAVQQLRQQLSERDKQLQQMLERLVEVNQQLTTTRLQHRAVQPVVKGAGAGRHLTLVQDAAHQLSALLDVRDLQLQAARADCAEMHQQLNGLQEQAAAVELIWQQQAAQVEREHGAQLAAGQQELQVKEQQLQQTLGKLMETAQELRMVHTQAAAAQQAADSSEAALHDAQDELAVSHVQVAALQQQLEQAAGKVTDLQQQLQDEGQQRALLGCDAEQWVREAQAQATAAQQAAAEHQAANETLQQQLHEKEQQLRTALDKLVDFADRLQHSHKQAAAGEGTSTGDRAKLKAAVQQLSEQQQLVATLQQQLHAKEQLVANMQLLLQLRQASEQQQHSPSTRSPAGGSRPRPPLHRAGSLAQLGGPAAPAVGPLSAGLRTHIGSAMVGYMRPPGMSKAGSPML